MGTVRGKLYAFLWIGCFFLAVEKGKARVSRETRASI